MGRPLGVGEMSKIIPNFSGLIDAGPAGWPPWVLRIQTNIIYSFIIINKNNI